METPHQLMLQVAKGDKQAFSHLVGYLGQDMFSLAYRVLNYQHEAAEEALQEALIRLWQKAPNWRAESKVETYAYRLVYNAAVDWLRQNAPSKNVVGLAEAHLENSQNIEGYVEDPAKQAEMHEREIKFKSALQKLPERQRTAVILTYFFEQPQAEVAATMGTTVRAVEGLLSRSRSTLKEMEIIQEMQGGGDK